MGFVLHQQVSDLRVAALGPQQTEGDKDLFLTGNPFPHPV